MSEPIKQTLFNFRTVRAPELLSSEEKQNFFIEHYNGTSGDFFEAVAAMGPNDIKKDVLKSAASSYVDKKTKAEIIAIDPNLYAFGLMLLNNRKTITHAEVATAITGLSIVANGDRKILWDNLFYQTITLESGYTREAILIQLVANHIVLNFASIPATDADMKKWANSRVVSPDVLFGVDSELTGITTQNELATGTVLLHKSMQSAENKALLEQLNQLKKEALSYKSEFLKLNNGKEQEEISTYATAVKTALSNATKVDYIDQFTKFTFQEYTNYVEPAYNYVKPDEIKKDGIGSVLSKESNYLMEENNLYDTKTFNELESEIDKIITKLTTSIFENSSFYNEKIAIDGTLISKCDIDQRFSKKYSFVSKLVRRSTDKYSVFLTLDVKSSCLKLIKATSAGNVPINTIYDTKRATNSKGIVHIDLTGSQLIDMSQNETVDFSSELEFDNGLKLSLSSITISKGNYIHGVLTEKNPPESSTNLEIPSEFGVKRLGIADYRKVEQTLCCYVPGEVSHIENVMAREYKERSTRRLRRQEDTTTLSSSSEVENQSDTSSTTRFDMKNEISNILSESSDFGKDIGFNASSSGSTSVPLVGDVDFTLGTDYATNFATSNSQEQSENQSTSFAQDVTEKALSRVTSNVSEERVSRIVEEFEEKNQHGFDNRQGAEHISGVFRWVDKVYKNEIQNYGKRLQYEFMIPEPAEFHLLAKASGANTGNDIPLVKPLDPRTNSFGSLSPIRNSAHIVDTNYHQWAAVYGATVTAPPSKSITVGKVLTKPEDGKAWYESSIAKDEIVIPEGYGIDTIYMSVGGEAQQPWASIFISAAGYVRRHYGPLAVHWIFTDSYTLPELRKMSGSIPVSADFIGYKGGSVSFTAKLDRGHTLMEEWQLETFNAIMAAYEDRLQDYKDALAELEAKQGILQGDNPAYYRRTENTVLKKSCISYLTGFNYLGQDHTVGSESTTNQANLSLNFDKYSAAIKFFEQAFEWELMDYHFYPFYWANRDKWEELYGTDNDDALFRSFLRSGMARTIVTVRPGFEEAVMYYMSTGLIWNGGEVPIFGDDLYLSIIEELSKPEYKVGDSWETRVPSTLTVIQAKTIGLEADGLPCYCDSDTLPEENIIVPPVNPLTNLDVHIDGLNTTP